MTILALNGQVNPANAGLPTRQDFENAINMQATPAILSALIPAGTADTYVNGPRTTMGFKYEWLSAGVQWQVWGHDPDSGAQEGTISKTDWTFRVKSGNQFLSPIPIGTGQGGLGAPSRWWGGQHAEKTHILLVRA